MSALTERTEDGMEVYLSEIHECLDEFIRDRGVEDMEKAGQNKWSAALRYIGQNVFKNTQKLKREPYDDSSNLMYGGITNNNSYDLNKLHKVADYYISLCYDYDKEVSINGFCFLTTISKDLIAYWGGKGNGGYAEGIQEAGPAGLALYKKLSDNNEETLSGMLISGGKRAPVAILGALNRRHGWNMGQPTEAPQGALVAEQTAADIASRHALTGSAQAPQLPNLDE